MFAAYNGIRNEFGTGTLDMAIKNKDFLIIPEILGEILPKNQEFLEMTAERFSELASGKRKS